MPLKNNAVVEITNKQSNHLSSCQRQDTDGNGNTDSCFELFDLRDICHFLCTGILNSSVQFV